MIRKKYKTEQKKELLEYMIKNNSNFISAEDIKQHLEQKNINVGLTTIYRFLNSLEKQGKVRIDLKKHTKYYQYIEEECNNHYHLKCKKCGKVIHFDCEEIELFNAHLLEQHKFKIDSNTIILGTCMDCMRD